MINTKLLAEICEVAGASGFEQRVREIVLREVPLWLMKFPLTIWETLRQLKKEKILQKK